MIYTSKIAINNKSKLDITSCLIIACRGLWTTDNNPAAYCKWSDEIMPPLPLRLAIATQTHKIYLLTYFTVT